MAEYQLRDFFKDLFSMKKTVCISVVLSMIVCAGIGYYRFKHTQTGNQKTMVETYEKSLKNFDEALKGIEANIATTQSQIDVQKKFLDRALFLKIDSSNVQVIETGYILNADSEESKNIPTLTGIYVSAFERGKIAYEVQKASPEYEELYLHNILDCVQRGNGLIVRIHHYDMVKAQKLLESVEKVMESIKKDITISHSLTRVSKIQYVMASDWLKRKQIEAQNELRGNQNTLAEFKRQHADFQNGKAYYARVNKPFTLVSASPVKTLIKYSAFGVFLGLLWPFLWINYKNMIK